MKTHTKHQEGHYKAMGMAIGLPISIPIGMILGHIALGFAIGLPLGFGIGLLMEKVWNKDAAPLTKEERARQRKWSMIAAIGGSLMLIFILLYYLLK